MDKNEFEDQLFTRKISRRDLNRTLASVGVAMITLPLVSRSADAEGDDDPVVFAWEGYEDPGLHGSYLKKYSGSPNFTFFADEEAAFAKIRAGFKPDVSMPCSYKVARWRDAGILAPIDTSRLSNWSDIIPSLQNVTGTVVDGERHWVCMDWGQTAIIYRTDLVEIEEESWGLLWDERYAGRLATIDNLTDGVMIAAIYGGAEDPFDMTAAEVQKTRKLLKEQLSVLRYFSTTPSDVQQALASGELVAAAAWNDSFTRLRRDGIPVEFMIPKEGAMTWTCGLSLMANADPKVLDRAYDIIDAMLSPEAGAFEIMNLGFGHANQKAYELVSDEDLAERGLTKNPDDVLKSGIFQKPIVNEPELQKMFEEVKAGI